MCHDAHAADPPLDVSETSNDVCPLLEFPYGYHLTDKFVDEWSQSYASRADISIALLPQHTEDGPQWSYCDYGEPWLPTGIENDACLPEPHTNYLPTPVDMVNNLLFILPKSSVCPTLVFEDSPSCASSIASSNGRPSWPWEIRAGFSCSLLAPGKCNILKQVLRPEAIVAS